MVPQALPYADIFVINGNYRASISESTLSCDVYLSIPSRS